MLRRLLHRFLLLLHGGGVQSLSPVASSEGCFPKSLTPPAEAQGAPPTFQFVPPSVSPKKVFLEKTSIGVRGSFSLHGNQWYGSGMAMTVADITVSFRCRCANVDECDDDISPTYTEFVPPSVVYVCRDTCCFGLRPYGDCDHGMCACAHVLAWMAGCS